MKQEVKGMSFKKKILTSMLMASVVVLSACSRQSKPIANKDGSILVFKEIETLEDGYYIVKSNGNIHPLLSEGVEGNQSNNSVVWFSDFDKLIPVFEEGDQLIIVRSTGFENNEETKFLKMRDSGWTIGAKFDSNMKRSSDGGLKPSIKFSGDYSPYSQASDAVSSVMGNDSKSELLDINGQEFTPNMLSPNGILQGLVKDAMYQFRYYVGTKYKFINMKADTHVFEGEREFTSPEFIEEQSTYFTVPIPDALEKGYYVLNGFGMFYYNAGEFTTD